MEYISQAEFARRVGVARQQVSIALQRGRIGASNRKGPGGHSLICWETESPKWEANRTDPLKGTGRPCHRNRAPTQEIHKPIRETMRGIPDVPDVADEVDGHMPAESPPDIPGEKIKAERGTYQWFAAQKLKIDAQRNELKYQQELMELLPFDDAVGIFYGLLVSVRDGVMAMAARNAGSLAARIRGMVREWNDGEDARLDALIREAFDSAGRDVLAEIEGYQRKDFKEEERVRQKAKKRKTRK